MNRFASVAGETVSHATAMLRPGAPRGSPRVDDRRRRGDDIGPVAPDRPEQRLRLQVMHRIGSELVAELPHGPAGQRLDLRVRVAQRPAEPRREDPPVVVLPRAHQPDEHEVADAWSPGSVACRRWAVTAARRRMLAAHGPLADDHRAVPDPRRGAHPADHRGRARARRSRPPAGTCSTLHARGRPDRPPHRLRHRRDEPRPVGRDPARRRELRRQPQLVRVPRGASSTCSRSATSSRPTRAGPRRRSCSRRVGGAGQGHPQQHPLRHDPGQRRVHRRRGASTSSIAEGAPAGARSPVQGEHGRRQRSTRCSPSAAPTCRSWS